MDVTVILAGTLAARTGTHRARVGVPEGATVSDVVDALADEYGPQVRPGVLEGEHIRSDTIVVRDAADAGPLTADSHVEPGDTVRFLLAA
ncbi:MoaD/ThiS family protein [Halobacteriaceae archaeon GCM10025711]